MQRDSIGVIFDMDGVLIQSEDAHFEAWRRLGAERGVEITHEVFLSTFGKVNADAIPILFGAGIGAGELERIADLKERTYRDIVRDDMPLSDGVAELLEGLRAAGARMAVGSSAPPENVRLTIDAGGLEPFFSAAVDGGQVENGKPAPDIFLRAAELLGVAPERCIVIEDAPVGFRAAHAAGMRVVGVAGTYDEDVLREAGAELVVASVAALTADAVLGVMSSAAPRPR